MTTRKSNIETETNQITAFQGYSRTVLVSNSRKSEKYHKPRGGTLSRCGRTNTEFERKELGDVIQEYEPCEKCFDGDNRGDD